MPVRFPPAEVHIDDRIVRELVLQQFPTLSALELSFCSSGWDNVTYRLGPELAVRLPRIGAAVPLLLNEQRWLPRLARVVEVPVPAPVHCGVPTAAYPWPFSIVPWREGVDAGVTPLLPAEAKKVGSFLRALHSADANGLGSNAWRGGPLLHRAEEVQQRIGRLREIDHGTSLDYPRLLQLFDRAVEAPLDVARCWIHGDLHPKNIVSLSGKLASVIDWGDMNMGDPANDLACAWLLFDPVHHTEMWRAYGVISEPTRRRAEGWAIFFGVTLLLAGLSDDDVVFQVSGRRTLERLQQGASSS
ncbi:MAG TPA: aminoglycoside phosphotransferase family protein [Polyangiaceae bacterium]|nr:aminoglycoside phosphotransferase family protein [Polyangiaceae bacterium]